MKFWPILLKSQITVGAHFTGEHLLLIALQAKKNWHLICHKMVNATSAEVIDDCHFVVSIPYHDIICRTLSLDARLTTKEIRQIICAQVKQHFGDIWQTLAIDFEILSGAEHKSFNTIRWTAAKQIDIEKICQKFHGFNSKITTVDVDAFALQYMGCFLAQKSNLQHIATAILHIYKESALLCVLQNNQCLFIQSANHYTELLKYFPGFSIEKIWLSSGETVNNFKTLAADIQKDTGIETLLSNPFLYLNCVLIKDEHSLMENAHVYTLPCALAMRAAH